MASINHMVPHGSGLLQGDSGANSNNICNQGTALAEQTARFQIPVLSSIALAISTDQLNLIQIKMSVDALRTKSAQNPFGGDQMELNPKGRENLWDHRAVKALCSKRRFEVIWEKALFIDLLASSKRSFDPTRSDAFASSI